VQLSANGGLNLFLGGLTSLHDDFISHHDRRSHGKAEFHILDIPEFLSKLRYRFDLNKPLVFLPQPGGYFREMGSGLSGWLIQKNSDFQHGLPP
jgi:hypothetical protein